jgi:hypothetical protein
VGVFTSFTLSQAGMVVHWFKERTSGWRASALMNGLGSLATLVVLGVIVTTKFRLGAWLVVVAIPVVVSLLLAISRHYKYVAARLSIQGVPLRSYIPRPKADVVTHPAVVVVGQLNRGTLEALDYARSIADEIVADRYWLYRQGKTAIPMAADGVRYSFGNSGLALSLIGVDTRQLCPGV